MKVFLILFSCFAQLILGQDRDMGIKVVYSYVNDFTSSNEVLFANEKIAVYTINPIENIWDNNTLPVISDLPTRKYRKVQLEQVEYYLNNENDLVIMNTVSNDRYRHIVKDSTVVLNWKLYDEQKIISGYKCYKAGLTWRGRNYTAYYTPEIPVSFGPHKFKNLPGLILSMESQTHGETHQWLASTITFNYRLNTDITIFPSDLKGDRITLFELVKYNDQLRQKDINVSRSRMKKGDRLMKVAYERNGVEKIYEWENQKMIKRKLFQEKDFDERNYKND